MGSAHTHPHGRSNHGRRRPRLLQLIGVALLAAAVVKELRTPAAERTWHGTLGGVVPYELRPPTVARVKERLWSPESSTLIGPHVFGVGWSVNVGRLVHLARQQLG